MLGQPPEFYYHVMVVFKLRHPLHDEKMAQARPLLYSPIARSLYERMLRDRELQNFDRSKWYQVDLAKVPDEVLRSRFVQCDLDGETEAFLEHSEQKSGSLFTQILHSLAKLFFGWFFTKTSLNGLLGRGSMFVFSRAQFSHLLATPEDDMSTLSPSPLYSSLLDIGAGDGNVTAVVAPLFSQVDVTEMSPVMRRLLAKRGFRVLNVYSWKPDTSEPRCEEQFSYDVICCLNVLDRCERPLTLLDSIRSKMVPETSRLVLAVVFPVSQYVESGQLNNQPTEKLDVRGNTLEEQVASFYHNVLVPSGFSLLSWTRLPYLCEGDLEQAFYWLDDVVMVLRRDSPSRVS